MLYDSYRHPVTDLRDVHMFRVDDEPRRPADHRAHNAKEALRMRTSRHIHQNDPLVVNTPSGAMNVTDPEGMHQAEVVLRQLGAFPTETKPLGEMDSVEYAQAVLKGLLAITNNAAHRLPKPVFWHVHVIEVEMSSVAPDFFEGYIFMHCSIMVGMQKVG